MAHRAVTLLAISVLVLNSWIQLTPSQDIDIPCILDVQKDLPQPLPLLLKPGSTDFWPVEKRGYLEIHRDDNIELFCTQGFEMDNKRKSFNATCIEGNTFRVGKMKLPFDKLICKANVKYKIRETKKKCADNAKIFEVGFNVSSRRFIKTLDICHDEWAVNTLWSYYKLGPANVHFQNSIKRPSFSEAGFFRQRDMNSLYSKNSQKFVFESLLGSNYHQYLDDKALFLARGHLSAKTDHIFATQQLSTFNFFNVAPQWQVFNGGPWSTVENGVREIVANESLEVECYTGTWGIMSLPNQNGKQIEIYLSIDENNNGEVPVPKLYYKVVVDTKSRKGVVIVGVNNPFVSRKELEKDYIICDDVSKKIEWIKLQQDLAKGYLYACNVNDFIKTVKDLPSYLKNVNKLLT